MPTHLCFSTIFLILPKVLCFPCLKDPAEMWEGHDGKGGVGLTCKVHNIWQETLKMIFTSSDVFFNLKVDLLSWNSVMF